MKRQGLLSVSGILLLGLIVLMTLHEWGNPLDPSEREAFLNAPAIIASNVTAKSYSPDGEVEYRLNADHLLQYERDPRTLLANPHLKMNNRQGVWTIRSKEGEVLDNGDLILFKDQVVAHSEARGITLKTGVLRYHDDTRVINTPSGVTITHQQGRTRAGSMTVDLDTGKMHLKQGVVSDFNGPRQ